MAAGRRGGRGRSRRAKSGSAYAPTPKVTLSSVPTGRAAYVETRKWLLKTHGPVCAYCAKTFPPATLTLDHVTPRRGQTAYDRRDNLVLCCKSCNSAKADKPFLVWVLHNRERARHLFAYGQHLSDGILDMLRPMVGDDVVIPTKPAVHHEPKPKKRRLSGKEIFGRLDDSGPSPYADEPDAPAKAPANDSGAPKKRTRRGGRGRKRAK